MNVQLDHTEEAKDDTEWDFLSLGQEVTQPFSSSLLPSCKSSSWCPGSCRCQDSSICHQLLLEEDMQETKNVSAPGGGTGLKSHLEFAEQFAEMRGMALRGITPSCHPI